MSKLNSKNYNGAISLKEITDVSDQNSDIGVGVKKIQEVKEHIVLKIFSTLGKIDNREMKNSGEMYLGLLEEIENIEITDKDNIAKLLKSEIENMYKKQSPISLGNKKGYIGDFNYFIRGGISEIKDESNTKNSRKKELNFDEDLFNTSLQKDIEPKNIKCFFEEDFNGNKNYFSINTLINYIDTFGIEVGLFEMNSESIPDEIRKKYFPSLNRRIKTSMYKTILQDLRDKQEILMYNFQDYKIQEGLKGIKNEDKPGMITEKIIEIQFRELAQNSNYKISIQKASVGEDQKDKIDLFIILEDQKTGINITEELQITIKSDLTEKKAQIRERNRKLDKDNTNRHSELLKFKMGNLKNKINSWKYYNRPIGKLGDTLNRVEKSTIENTFNRLVSDLERKKEKLIKKHA